MTSPRRSLGGFRIGIGKQDEKFTVRHKRIPGKEPVDDELRMTKAKGLSKSEHQITRNRCRAADSSLRHSGFSLHLSFGLHRPRNVSRSPAITPASKRMATHAELHLAHPDS